MGGAAGKQTKVKKIYVKAADTIDASQDASEDDVGHFSSAPQTFAEQLEAARALGSPSQEAAGLSRWLGTDTDGPAPTLAAGTALGDESTTLPSEVARSDVEVQGITAALEDVKPLVNSAVLQPGNVKAKGVQPLPQDRNEAKGVMNTSSKSGYSLSPRSSSSDEGNTVTLNNRPQFINPLAARTELFSPKEAFAEIIKDSYENRSQERAAWLRSLGEVTETRPSPPLGTDARQAFGFNDTRKALPAFRDPDACIEQEVKKFNVRMHSDEAPPGARVINSSPSKAQTAAKHRGIYDNESTL